MASSIAVKHNIEVAHRLYELPGKCEQIHGHSMWVTMELFGDVNSKGILGGIEYGDLKKLFRGYLDTEYDHRLLLNMSDPFSQPLFMIEDTERGLHGRQVLTDKQIFLPGLQTTVGDPTTENLAKWISQAMLQELVNAGMVSYLDGIDVTVWETSVNMARESTKLVEGVLSETD